MSQSEKPETPPAKAQNNTSGPRKKKSDPVVSNDTGPADYSHILSTVEESYSSRKPEEIDLGTWISRLKDHPEYYQDTPPLLAREIGPGEEIDVSEIDDPRERQLFNTKVRRRYPFFGNFYGAEDRIEKLVSFLSTSRGNKMMISLGPTGSGKTATTNALEEIFINNIRRPILRCALTDSQPISPFNDSPLSLFSSPESIKMIASETGIDLSPYQTTRSPWVTKRLAYAQEKGIPLSQLFTVSCIYPDVSTNLIVGKIDPGTSTMPPIDDFIGKTNKALIGRRDPLIKGRLLTYGDPDAYIPGILSKAHGGLFHFAEAFRQNKDLFNVLLETLEEGSFVGGDGIGRLPCKMLISGTSNVPVWSQFLSLPQSDALRDRVFVINYPYSVRVSEEVKIIRKEASRTRFSDAPVAPGTESLLARFGVATRIRLDLSDTHGSATKDNKVDPSQAFDYVDLFNGDTDRVARGLSLAEIRQMTTLNHAQEGLSPRKEMDILAQAFGKNSGPNGSMEADTFLVLEAINEWIDSSEQNKLLSKEEADYYRELAIVLADSNNKAQAKYIEDAIREMDETTNQVRFEKYCENLDKVLGSHEKARGIMVEGVLVDKNVFIENHLVPFETIVLGEGEDPRHFRKSTHSIWQSRIANIAQVNENLPEGEKRRPLKVHYTECPAVQDGLKKYQSSYSIATLKAIIMSSDPEQELDENQQALHKRAHDRFAKDGLTSTMVNRLTAMTSHTPG